MAGRSAVGGLGVALAGCAGLLVATLPSACAVTPERIDRPIVLHVPAACVGDLQTNASAYSVFQAGGDFATGSLAPTDGTPLDEMGMVLADLPAAAKSITVNVADDSSSAWLGMSLIGTAGPVDIIAWPNQGSCAFAPDIERADATIGAFDDHHVLIVGGSGGVDGTPHSFVADMQTGQINAMSHGLLTSRESPTITAFGNGALVAGGTNPNDPAAEIDTAEVYVHAEPFGDFDPTPIYLSSPRANHGAVTLANGQTLLVGGTDEAGRLLPTMELVDPVQRRATTLNVAQLKYPRMNPTVMRLASGEVLVAGGFTPETSTLGLTSLVPVPQLEWFSPDGLKATKTPNVVPPTQHRAFVPMDAGGALAVVAPDESDGEDTDFSTTYVIGGDGSVTAMPPSYSVPALKGDDVRMFRGVDGSPMLFTGTEWFEYDPWTGVFTQIATPTDGPRGAMTSVDPGLALWLENADTKVLLVGYRFGTNNPYAPLPPDLLTADANRSANHVPAYFVPDHAPEDSYGWDPVANVLDLPVGDVAMLSDVTFANFTIDFVSPSGETPLVVLRDDAGTELDVGGPECLLAVGSAIHVERHGAVVTSSVDGSELTPCNATVDPTARLHVGLAGSDSVASLSRASAFTIVRTDN